MRTNEPPHHGITFGEMLENGRSHGKSLEAEPPDPLLGIIAFGGKLDLAQLEQKRLELAIVFVL